MGKPKAHPLTSLLNRRRGEEIVLVGFGGSLVGFDWSILDPWTTIGLNDVILHHMPSYHLFVDSHLANRKYCKVQYRDPCRIVCQPPAVQTFINKTPTAHDRMFSFRHQRKPSKHDQDILYCDRTVACAGLDLACRLGAATVYMIGIDGCGRGGGHYYYADKAASRGGKKIDRDRSKKQLATRARKENVPLKGALERIDTYDLYLEPRHLDWWSNMGTVWKHWHREDRDFSVPRVVNLSPWSIFTMWETVDSWDESLAILKRSTATTVPS